MLDSRDVRAIYRKTFFDRLIGEPPKIPRVGKRAILLPVHLRGGVNVFLLGAERRGLKNPRKTKHVRDWKHSCRRRPFLCCVETQRRARAKGDYFPFFPTPFSDSTLHVLASIPQYIHTNLSPIVRKGVANRPVSFNVWRARKSGVRWEIPFTEMKIPASVLTNMGGIRVADKSFPHVIIRNFNSG